MPLTINLAVAKTNKYGSRESGDTVEVIERPSGGFSIVVVDAQGSGARAKLLSVQLAGRAVGLLSDGVRDGAAARAIHDFLHTTRNGRVSAALDLISVDLVSRSVLFTRNSEVPMVLRQNGEVSVIRESGGRVGFYRHIRPRVLEYPAGPGLLAVLMTDGVASAGDRWGVRLDLRSAAQQIKEDMTAEQVAEILLGLAMDADQGRPQDDMTVVVLSLDSGVQRQPIRRLTMEVPFLE